MGHDDTTAFNSASTASALTGEPVFLPNNCAVRNFTPASGSTLTGQTGSLGYNYGILIKPNLYILESGFPSDPDTYGINLGSGKYGIALRGFEIQMPIFPYLLFGMTGTCIGTGSGTLPYNQGVAIEGITFQFCPIGFGLNYGGTSTGHLFFQSRFNEFANNGWGMMGVFSDTADIDSVFTGNFSGGVWMGNFGSPNGYGTAAGRWSETRFEEGGTGLLCDNCISEHLEGVEFQFDGGTGDYS